MAWLILSVITAALADSVNPCAFSVLFLTIAFLFSLGKSRQEIIKIGLIYVLGIYLIYLAIGLGILQTLTVFGVPRIMSKIGAMILLFWGGLNLADLLIPNFPIKLRIPDFTKSNLAKLIHKASYSAVFLLGLLVGASEFPCTGGPYLMILGLLHDKATFINGLGYLVLYNLIFVSPLLIILFFGSDDKLHAKVEQWRKTNLKTFELVASIILILMGLVIFYV